MFCRWMLEIVQRIEIVEPDVLAADFQLSVAAAV